MRNLSEKSHNILYNVCIVHSIYEVITRLLDFVVMYNYLLMFNMTDALGIVHYYY